jgi:hypothetical protein
VACRSNQNVKNKNYQVAIFYQNFLAMPIYLKPKGLKPMSNQNEKPPIHTDTYGLKTPKAAQAGVGARNIEEIREATTARTRPGQYNNSENR